MNARPAIPWSAVEAKLRPFVAARVHQPADVDDILQTVLLRTYERVGSVRDERRLSGWLHAVARNAITDHYRARRHDALPELVAEAPEPDELSALVAQAMAGFVEFLPEIYRDAIRWTELDGLTQQQAADRAGISLSGMKSRVQRGRAKLIELMRACCELELDRRGGVIDCTPRAEGCEC